MEINFTVKTDKKELIIKEKHTLFWLRNNNSSLLDKIGVCKVQLEQNEVNCKARKSYHIFII